MNWRDNRDGLTHVMDYSFASAWGTKAADHTLKRTRCGIEARIGKDGAIESIGNWRPIVLVLWLHTDDAPTCLTCITQVRKHDVDDGS